MRLFNNTSMMFYFNNTSRKHHEPKCIEHLGRAFVFAQVAEGTAITIINLFVVMLYFLMKKGRRKISNYLLLNQSITDIYISMCLWFELIVHLEHVPNGTLLGIVHVGMLEYSLVLSLGTLLLGASERYLSISRAYYHKCNVTLLRIFYATITVWFLSFVPTVILLSLMDFNPENSNHSHVIIYSYVFDAIMLSLLIGAVYMLLMTLKTARSSCTLRIQLSDNYSSLNRRKESFVVARRKSTRLLVIFLIMIFAYIVTFLPFIIGRLCYDMGTLDQLSPCIRMSVAYMCHIFYKSSALFNPFLTIFLKEDYKCAMLYCFRCHRMFLLRENIRLRRQRQHKLEVSRGLSLFNTTGN